MLRPVVFILLAMLIGGVFWLGEHDGRNRRKVDAANRRILYYVDPMNPAHTSDKPGLAPCGMEMQPIYADQGSPAADRNQGPAIPGSIIVSPEKQQLIGVQTGVVEHKAWRHVMRLPGRVALDETRIYRINATLNGWITQALPNPTGTLVHRDEVLGTFYSPEFLAAEQALVFALNAQDRLKKLESESSERLDGSPQTTVTVEQSKATLKNLGMSDRQLQELVQTRKLVQNVDIVAPGDGVIIARNMADGLRFDSGFEWFRLANLNQVWIVADVYATDSQFIKPGAEAQIMVPGQTTPHAATVSSTLPQFDTASRTLKVRLHAANPAFVFKPEMWVDVELAVDLPETLVAPSDAVLDAGLQKTVFLARDGNIFEPRSVETGWRYDGMVEIRHGVEAGDKIVVSGNFLLDSESRMKAAAAGLRAIPAKDPVCGMKVNESEARTKHLQREYQGTVYYFCAAECLETFDKNPGAYAGKMRSNNPGTNLMPHSTMGSTNTP